MPPRKRTEETPGDVLLGGGPAPAFAADLCTECGGSHALDPSTTHYTCEHGTWVFKPAAAAEPEPEASPEEARAALLAEMSEDELRAALAARATPPVE